MDLEAKRRGGQLCGSAWSGVCAVSVVTSRRRPRSLSVVLTPSNWCDTGWYFGARPGEAKVVQSRLCSPRRAARASCHGVIDPPESVATPGRAAGALFESSWSSDSRIVRRAGFGSQRPLRDGGFRSLLQAVGNHGVRCRAGARIVPRSRCVKGRARRSRTDRVRAAPVWDSACDCDFGVGPATCRWVGVGFAGACWVVVAVATSLRHSDRMLWRPERDVATDAAGPQGPVVHRVPCPHTRVV